MTNEEVIENLEYAISGDCTGNLGDFVDEIELAINALKKQIPKVPTIWVNGEVIESYECPSCNTIYDFDTDGKLKYCHECGQRLLDWGDEE